jgi:ElaB/YqjD/DUF883 family membrane-anchored ribosome-binding protein
LATSNLDFSTTDLQELFMTKQSHGADATGQSGVAREYHAFVSDVEDLVSSATSLTGEDLARVKAKLSARISSAKDSLVQAGGVVSDQVRSGAKATDAYVRTQPWQAVGISAAAGLLLGYLLGRRGD